MVEPSPKAPAESKPIITHGQSEILENVYSKIGIYGWRKRCLYGFIIGLLIMITINLALTLWVLRVMEFSTDGMSLLKIISSGLRVDGKAVVMDRLITSTINSRARQSIVIESSRNLTLSTRNHNGRIENLMLLGDGKLECLAGDFKIKGSQGNVVFAVDEKEVLVGTECLEVTGDGGTVFEGSVQTPLVRAAPGNNLKLESPTKSLEIVASEGIHLQSYGGLVRVVSQKDLSLKSTNGGIVLRSKSIKMPFLPVIKDADPYRNRQHKLFQMCVCQNGKLFLASSEASCYSNDVSVCG